MDLATLEFDDVVEHVIVGKDGKPTDIVFLLAGPGHPVRVDLDRRLTAKTLRQFNARGKATLTEDPDELRAQETERMVELTLGWKGVTDAAANAVSFSKEAVRAAYENRRSGVRAQVLRALAELANFTASSSSN